MPARRSVRLGAAAAAAAAVSSAVILLNLALLGYAQPRNDPVGKLSPRAALVPAPTFRPAPIPRPATPRETNGEADD
jgi:hypothetical protein